MKTKKWTILNSVLIILLFTSCMNKIKFVFAGHESKYWDCYVIGIHKYDIPEYCFEFRSNGECYYYYTVKPGLLKRRIFKVEDVLAPDKWNLISDSLVEIRGYKYKIKSLSESRITIMNTRIEKDSFVLKTSEIR